MSAFGGDSWAREAECRKKRVNELICEQLNEGDYQKLRNGKYACLVCPNRPVVDTLHMLLMHSRGTRHRAAAHRLREKELSKKEEMQKRMALCETSITLGDTDTLNGSLQCSDSFASPLLRQTWKSTADALANRNSTLGNTIVSTRRDNQSFDCTSKYKPFFDSLHARNVNSLVKKREAATHHVQSVLETVTDSKACMQNNVKAVSGTVSQQQLDLQKQREKELKLRASGWQRDGNGGWFRQEDVGMQYRRSLISQGSDKMDLCVTNSICQTGSCPFGWNMAFLPQVLGSSSTNSQLYYLTKVHVCAQAECVVIENHSGNHIGSSTLP